MPLQRNSQLLNDLQDEWYKKLHDEGFRDIEDTSSPKAPLFRFHSFDLPSQEAQVRSERRSIYQLRIDSFANDPAFPEITLLMTKHWNSKFKAEDIEVIWTLHRDGFTERGIAAEMNCSKSCIHFLLQRMREWMKLI